jgi:hypothetical protein
MNMRNFTFKDGVKLTRLRDSKAKSPREFPGVNVGHIDVIPESHYATVKLGDASLHRSSEYPLWPIFRKHLNTDHKALVILPMYMHCRGHNHPSAGFRISLDECPTSDWVSWGQIGYIWAAKEDILRLVDGEKIRNIYMETARSRMAEEIQEYSAFMEKKVYRYRLSYPNGNTAHIQLAGGFLGEDWNKNGLLGFLNPVYRKELIGDRP